MLNQISRLRAPLAAFAAAATLAGCALFEDLKPTVDFMVEAGPDGPPSFRFNLKIGRSINPADAQADQPPASTVQPSQPD